MEGHDSEEDLDKEEAMIYFMTVKENEDEDRDHEVNDQNLSYDELFCASEEMHGDMRKLLKRNNILKNEVHHSPKRMNIMW